jgi:arylsulfatase A-like enzyme
VVLGPLLACLVASLAACSPAGGASAEAPSPSVAPAREPREPETQHGTEPVSEPQTERSRGPRIEPPRRPNLLVVEADDMRADDLRWMPRTRRLLGGAGLTFHNALSPNPLCCPARASLLTGRYSHNHEVLTHSEPYGFRSFDDRHTLATALQDAGYRTALVGKYLNGYGQQTTADGEDSLVYVPPGWTQWYGSTDRWWGPGEPFAGGTYDYFHLTSNVNGELRSWPGEYSTEVTSRQVQSLVEQFERRPGDRPWFLWWTPVAPHHGLPVEPDDPGVTTRSDGHEVLWVDPARPEWVKGRFDDRIVHGLGVPADGDAEDDVADKPRYLRNYPGFTDEELEALTTVSRQRAEALFALDVEVARTLGTLAATGAAADTVVVFTSDNGYYLGEHRKRQGKITLHEPSIRVPLLVAGAGVPHGERFDPVTSPDLGVTLARLGGVRLRRADGADVWPVVTDGDQGWLRPVVLEGRMPEWRYRDAGDDPAWESPGLGTSGLRLGRYKVIRYATGEAEVYDLLEDPLELRNLSREHPALRRRLTALWRQYVLCARSACRQELPEPLRLPAEVNRQLTLAQQAAAEEYHTRR